MERTYHLVNRLNNSQHLLITDLSITIDIIQLKRPLQFILHVPSTRDTQRADELLEIDRPAVVTVEDFEDVFGETGRVAEGEELSVDLLEFFFCESAAWVVFQEAYRKKKLGFSSVVYE